MKTKYDYRDIKFTIDSIRVANIRLVIIKES